MDIIRYAKYLMTMIRCCCWILRFHLLESAFQIDIDDEQHSFLSAVILEIQSLVVLAR